MAKVKEWKTLHDSLNGKNFSDTPDQILAKAKSEDSQRAVMGLILYHATDEGLEFTKDDLPYSIKVVGGKIKITGKKLPMDLMKKINQLLMSKKK